ncbi:hypothetical protein A3C59_04640 [Candidatus Daviesbacteria bacterium RIFCSPHIGHO2_02_FULL_36_13]|uniref:Uncharacterized protein n=1 Tax=Candidatus Daviesbacteria bacterium RIFCSPHIGHO2_02_FULL_36_13 TaxID=1797768 RepID=A0A1F5JUG4_9BACT|nr:MAG: hypothetical protein A3C59_04640 [Candidatus Daviesbacteria bacterium RIFCSPHIGHO2_02_FULL_36_13]OGE41583.1 MAG: hypothetical protein A3A45_00890 [Candidatus Daviesbacteria bacterium RIFCSPLOWO2_01_FULL_36_8]
MGPVIEDNRKKNINRSAAYPSASLAEALEYAATLKQQLGKGPYDRETAARALGHGGVNGASAAKIAALVHFGLLTRAGNTYSQSALSDRIFLSTSEEEKNDAILESVKTPKLYKALINKYSGSALPGLLENILVRDHKIAEKVAKKATDDFKKSLEYVGLLKNGVVSESPEVLDDSQNPQGLVSREEKDAVGSSNPHSQNQLNLGNYYPVELPSGIIVQFPSEMSYQVTIGKFAIPIEQLEETAQNIISKQQTQPSQEKLQQDNGGVAREAEGNRVTDY